jgi:hypothetical protein
VAKIGDDVESYHPIWLAQSMTFSRKRKGIFCKLFFFFQHRISFYSQSLFFQSVFIFVSAILIHFSEWGYLSVCEAGMIAKLAFSPKILVCTGSLILCS